MRKIVILSISILLLYGCKGFFKDIDLNRKIIESSKYKIVWYTKGSFSVTKVYPEYIKIINKEEKTNNVIEESAIDDINLLLGDTLEITYGRHYILSDKDNKDTIISDLLIRYQNSKLDYNNTVRFKTFE
ncbi:hypothetical protein [Apibacter adventoris]|uniref:Lipoprotein n=1 Tax=Apibacter adventoris TaxID=1679466 RepID=A0A2S8AFD6_9FLAO|nr:hypothetical protein [Apibacter adventoris]PQL94745.1 hypothetical protein C4S77_02735 [Apibacter adventoris]